MPITDSRMFYDDIPHGLCVLFGIAEILHVPTPMISKMIIENQIMMGKEYLVQTPDAKGKLLEYTTARPYVFNSCTWVFLNGAFVLTHFMLT